MALQVRQNPRALLPGQQDKVRAIASALAARASIPLIMAQLPRLQALPTDEYWQDVTAPMLESARKGHRVLIRLIEKGQRHTVVSNFTDAIGLGTVVDMPGVDPGMNLDKFRATARFCLRNHDDLLAVQKLRRNKPLTATDLAALEQVLLQAGIGTPEEIERAKAESEGLGLFARSLVGLDRQAAVEALSAFQAGKTFTADQLEFLRLLTEHLVENGYVDPGRLYESPYTDFHPAGVSGLFAPGDVGQLLAVLEGVRQGACVTEHVAT